MGEKSAERILKSLNDSLQVPYERVLYALGIRYVGQTVAKTLAKAIPSIDLLAKATVEELVEIDEIGDKIAVSIVNYFADENHRRLIERLKQYGLQLEKSVEDMEDTTDILKGLSIVISGTFSKYSRNELKELIEQNGGKNVGSISKKTGFLLAGENIGPSKMQKVEKLGIPIKSENEFLEMIGKL